MKVAIPTTDKKTIYGHTGHADFFLVVTIEEGKVINKEFRDNPHVNHEDHGHHPDHEPGHHDHDHDHDHHNHLHGDENAHDKMIESIDDCKYFVVKHVGRRCAPSLKKFDVRPVLIKGHGDILIDDILEEVIKMPVE